MKRILREPLLQFLLAGTAIFAVNGLLSWRAPVGKSSIVVTRGRIESLSTAFGLTWQRPPSAAELDELIRDYVREEAAVREAMRLGLDKEDVVVRHRLRQKLELVSEDAAQAEPTDAQLQAWLDSHRADFSVDPTFTFSHVYLSPEGRGASLARDAAQLLGYLRRARGRADLTTLGDPFLLGHQFAALPARDVRSQFGPTFAAVLDTLRPGRWAGPFESSYGAHLVLLRERVPARMPALEEVRDAVHRAWSDAQRAEANEKLYQTLLQRYKVKIEKWEPAAGGDTSDGTRPGGEGRR